jgi:tetratricopeptide (TPR) repeat protein
VASAGNPGGRGEVPARQELSATLFRLRRAHGLSQRDLRRPLRVGSHTTIGDWEAGRRLPSAAVVSAYERYFKLPPGQLLTLRERALGEGLAAESPAVSPGHPGAAGPSRPPRSLPMIPQVRYSLPADTAAFTGRSGALEQITAMVAGAAGAGGLIAVGAIDGMPGVGKTSLAVHVAHALAARFPDRQMFIDLHAHTPGREPVRPEDALAGLLATTGVDPTYLPGDLDGRAAMWRDRMAGQRALLVLDNAASSGQVTPLLPGGGCLVLVTSRRHLGDLPGAVTPVLLDVLLPEEAEEMFTRLAPRAAAGRDGVEEVVGLAGFLPLAISLLARVFARHPSWIVADLAAETRAGLLTMAAEKDSIAAAFEVSYRHLDGASERLFRLLGVHPGEVIDGYAAAALAGIRLREAVRLLDGLHQEGLVTEAGHRRYGMHDLLRRYARDLAAAPAHAADSQTAIERLLDYYQYTSAQAGISLARQVRPGPAPAFPAAAEIPALEDAGQALAWARADRACLLACLDLAVRTGRTARVVALTAGLAALLWRDGPWAEAVIRHNGAVEAARCVSDRLGEANALTDVGTVLRLTGDHGGAAEALHEALDIYRDFGDRLGEANALDNLAVVRLMTGDHREAAGALEEALGIYRGLGDQLGEANALTGLGTVLRLTGDHQAAAGALGEALGIYRGLGNRLGEANALLYLGIVREVTGDYRGAAGVLGEALGICRGLGERLGEANALLHLVTMRRVTGDCQGAAGVLEEALGIYRDLGNRLGETEALNEQGTLDRVRGDLASAQECHRQALELARAIGSSLDEAYALAGQGRCAVAIGRTTEAEVLLRQALEIFQRIGAAEAREVLAELDAWSADVLPR